MSLTNEERAEYGRAAITAGSPDFNGDDFDGFYTDAGDAIANILHALYQHVGAANTADALAVFGRAEMHFMAEIDPDDIEEAFQRDDEED